MIDELQIVEYNGVKIVTTKQVADAYEIDVNTISKGFGRNKWKFTEGKHYFKLDGDKLKSFREILCGGQNGDNKICDGRDITCKNSPLQISNKTRVLYLWTNRGTLLLAKIIDTDTAWAAYERLVDFYFDVKERKVEPITEKLSVLPYQTSSTPIPKNTVWFNRNKGRMEWICAKYGIKMSYLLHKILERLKAEYDLEAANRLYLEEKGEPPKYPMDIVDFFIDLSTLADAYLDRIEEEIRKRR